MGIEAVSHSLAPQHVPFPFCISHLVIAFWMQNTHIGQGPILVIEVQPVAHHKLIWTLQRDNHAVDVVHCHKSGLQCLLYMKTWNKGRMGQAVRQSGSVWNVHYCRLKSIVLITVLHLCPRQAFRQGWSHTELHNLQVGSNCMVLHVDSTFCQQKPQLAM